jgi:hypothetical protein
MKKILAIAVASAIAAPAMADMTISGTIVAGYSSNTADYEVVSAPAVTSTAAGTTVVTKEYLKSGNAGFGIDTAALTIAGSETLENGLTVAGSMSAGGFTRGSSVDGENSSLSISGDFGKFEIASSKAGSGTFGFANVGGAEDFSAEISSESTADRISYSTSFGDVAVKAGFAEETGVGKGQDDGITTELQASYSADGLGLLAKYWDYSDAAKAAAADKPNNGMRLGVSYDAGAVVVAAAHSRVNQSVANTDLTETSVGVKIPAGAATIGLVYAKKTDEAVAYDSEGTSAAVAYPLSANVSVKASYATWNSGANQDEQKSSILATLKF